jgi:hypothetical protein
MERADSYQAAAVGAAWVWRKTEGRDSAKEMQMLTLPPALERIATTPVLASEMPAGLTHVKVSRLAPDPRYHTLGAVRIDFSNARESESASYALLRTSGAAARLAQTEANVKTGGLFHVQAVAVGRFAVAVAAKTVSDARTLLRLAVAHLHRSEP